MFFVCENFLSNVKKTSCKDGSIGFSRTYFIRYYPETSFTFQNKFNKNCGTSHKILAKKMELHELKKKKNVNE